jgi:hypothetical protein
MNKNGPDSFPWQEFLKNMNFGGNFPFKEGDIKSMMGDPFPWVEKYAKKAIANAMSRVPNISNLPNTDSLLYTPWLGGSPEVFETHRSVLVRLSVPESMEARNIRIFASSRQVAFEGIRQNKIKVPLPSAVSVKSAKAKLKNGILEVRLRKFKGKGAEREIFFDEYD